MIQNILVPFDFSPSSKRALSYAVDLVARTGAHLHLRHVQEIPLGPLVGGDPSPMLDEKRMQEEFEKQCREQLKDALLPDDDRLSFSAKRSGEVAPDLVHFADEENIDLIVMGTHGRRGVKRVFFGSTAEEVLRTAPCPVLTTRAEEGENGFARSSVSIERLVVPIDFSELSRAALQYAGRLADLYDAPLTLVHVVDLPALPATYEIDFSEADVHALEEKARSDLREWGRSLSIEDSSWSYVVDSGDPGATILRLASEPEDLLVMATRGLSGLKRTMLGSVAEHVLRRANGPVLTGRTVQEGD